MAGGSANKRPGSGEAGENSIVSRFDWLSLAIGVVAQIKSLVVVRPTGFEPVTF